MVAVCLLRDDRLVPGLLRAVPGDSLRHRIPARAAGQFAAQGSERRCFMWTLRAGQYEDLDGSATRILFDDD
ncbi:MAG TPA: cbb3-type cytochrome oxidase assembly protein CcoS [Rhodopila sp.]|nr:cbb3-type cytochrome oxidase assembly protein CcoS [Rhodopila sp.]